ncbi:oxygen-independent coproporphyrinogen III oxidase [Albimonas sp. CAU 1670]|uniref:oxygen-independent coproporphyrinogen III oxidase n=1 Tax=Albimonas sp. CAU 1670 TaxID=3032599 RepID=UPI0023DC15C2|nr:oxygen-independent coproporphyrinogen III oxidase [Albimonas sp. CAU 1670]MDF2233539.1 oxygen-independent coproporphyrinogen III oxidase [Albimonas sp. CAU 1670]
MDPVIARYARRAAPRYTSYPTAPHFRPDFEEAELRRWLGGLAVDDPVSLYLHVPFCRKMCWYCGCNMKLARRYEPVADYVESLLAHLALTADALPGRMAVSHLAWGGGTPTSLTPGDLTRVMEAVRERFDIREGSELAIEVDPRTLSPEMATRLGALGFTRASFGVQEFDPQVQQVINRVQPPEMVEAATQAMRKAGVGEISYDLIYGLPFQTVESLRRTVIQATGMGPQRIALFGYAHVPWMAKNQRMMPEEALPGPGERAAQAEAAAETLEALGYERVGLDHFALPDDPMAVAARAGTLRRNFQGYTTDTAETLLGLGATAITKTPDGFAQNLTETGAWARTVAQGRLPVARGLGVDADDRLRAWVIERLMCDFEVDLAAVPARFPEAPADWAEEALERLVELRADGMVEIAGSRVRMTPRGRPLVRVAASAFDARLARSEARHSLAV